MSVLRVAVREYGILEFSGSFSFDLVVLLTRACQLDCVYCRFSRDLPAIRPALLRRCADLLLDPAHPGASLQFLGGEPLLRFDLVLEAIRYVEWRRAVPASALPSSGDLAGDPHAGAPSAGAKAVGYVLATNGLLLDRRVLEALRPYPVRFILSLDGPPAEQEAARPVRGGRGPYPHDAQRRALDLLLEGGFPFSVHLVATPEAVERLAANAEHFLRLGVGQVHLQYQVGALWERGPAAAYGRQVLRILEAARRLGAPLDPAGLLDSGEPAIGSRSVTVDVDGRAYLGCTVPALEQTLPRLKAVNLLGDVRERDLPALAARAEGALQRLAESHSDDPVLDRVVRSNLWMGVLSRRLQQALAGGAPASGSPVPAALPSPSVPLPKGEGGKAEAGTPAGAEAAPCA